MRLPVIMTAYRPAGECAASTRHSPYPYLSIVRAIAKEANCPYKGDVKEARGPAVEMANDNPQTTARHGVLAWHALSHCVACVGGVHPPTVMVIFAVPPFEVRLMTSVLFVTT